MFHKPDEEQLLAHGLHEHGVLEFVPDELVPKIGSRKERLLSAWFGVGKNEYTSDNEEILRLIMNLTSNILFKNVTGETRTLSVFGLRSTSSRHLDRAGDHAVVSR